MPNIQIQTRRATAAAWLSTNSILASGELAYETDTNKFKFGNGTSNWTALPYAGGAGGPTANVEASTITLLGVAPTERKILFGRGRSNNAEYDATSTCTMSLSSDLVSKTVNYSSGPRFYSYSNQVTPNTTGTMYVAVGDEKYTNASSRGFSTVQWSSDLLNWNSAHSAGTQSTIGYSNQSGTSPYVTNCVKYFDNKWWIGCKGNGSSPNTNSLYASTDGSNWIAQTISTGATGVSSIVDIAYNGSNQYVAVANGGAKNLLYSVGTNPDGSHIFAPVANAAGCATSTFTSVKHANGVYIACCYTFDPNGSLLRSTDGSNWTKPDTSALFFSEGQSKKAVANNGSLWVAVGNSNGNIDHIWSADGGLTWATSAAGSPSVIGEGPGVDVIWTGSYFLAKGDEADQWWLTSPNGKNWSYTSISSGTFSQGMGAASNTNLFSLIPDTYVSSVFTATSISGPLANIIQNNIAGVRHITLSTIATILPSDQLVLVSTTATASNPTLYLSTSFQNGQRVDIRYVKGTRNIDILASPNTGINTFAAYPIVTLPYPNETSGTRGYENLVYSNSAWYSLAGDSIKYVAPPNVELNFANCSANTTLTSITVAWFSVAGAQSYKVFYSERAGGSDGTFVTYPPPIRQDPSQILNASAVVPKFTGQSNVITGTTVTLTTNPQSERISAYVYAYTDIAGTQRLTNFPQTCLVGNKEGDVQKLFLTKTQYSYDGDSAYPSYITETGQQTSYPPGVVNLSSKDLVA